MQCIVSQYILSFYELRDSKTICYILCVHMDRAAASQVSCADSSPHTPGEMSQSPVLHQDGELKGPRGPPTPAGMSVR